MARDSTRAKLYRSESRVDRYAPEKVNVEEYVRTVEADPRFRERYPQHRPLAVTVTDRWYVRKVAHYLPQRHEVHFSGDPIGRLRTTVLHEISHAVTPNALPSHGIEFTANMVWLFDTFLGVGIGDVLRESLAENKVRYEHDEKRMKARLNWAARHGSGARTSAEVPREKVQVSLLLRTGERVTGSVIHHQAEAGRVCVDTTVWLGPVRGPFCEDGRFFTDGRISFSGQRPAGSSIHQYRWIWSTEVALTQ